MSETVNAWVLENLYLIPAALIGLYLWNFYEHKRIDKRIDAVITLLKQRGIDILADDN